jgi:outer membrane murein-binding lipoprotein Lpp
MQEKDIIQQLKALKQIKPQEAWVVFTKNKITSTVPLAPVFPASPAGGSWKDAFQSLMGPALQQRLAYSFAVLLTLVATAGFMGYNGLNNLLVVKPSADQVALVKSNVETLKVKSKTLAEVSKTKPEEVKAAEKEAKDATNTLTAQVKKNPDLAKEVALEVSKTKTYLDMSAGDDLRQASENLYKTIVEAEIKDLGNTTLTDSQQETFQHIKTLDKQGKYSQALEMVLKINTKSPNSQDDIKGSNDGTDSTAPLH